LLWCVFIALDDEWPLSLCCIHVLQLESDAWVA
jgi:hypothetical protein